MVNTDFIDLLKTLIRQPSVVGAEHSFFRVLQRELEERGRPAPGGAPEGAVRPHPNWLASVREAGRP